MANEKKKPSAKSLANLKRITSENAREFGRRGGIRSGEVKRERKRMRETLGVILKMKPGSKEEQALLAKAGITDPDLIDNQTMIVFAMIAAAKAGDVSAAVWVRDTVGDKPVDEVHTTTTVSDLEDKLSDLSIDELRKLGGLDD